MARIAFPTQVPIAEISETISMVRDGSWKTKRRTFGENLFTVQGYGMGLVLRDDGTVNEEAFRSAAHDAGVEETQVDEFFDCLCEVHQELDPQSEEARKAINPAMVMTIIQMVLALLNKRNQ